jgi:hypothetical protein
MSRKNEWTVKVDGSETTFTREDVKRYFSTGHGMSGMRSFGPVSGDWRMIDAIAEDARAYFEM